MPRHRGSRGPKKMRGIGQEEAGPLNDFPQEHSSDRSYPNSHRHVVTANPGAYPRASAPTFGYQLEAGHTTRSGICRQEWKV